MYILYMYMSVYLAIYKEMLSCVNKLSPGKIKEK